MPPQLQWRARAPARECVCLKEPDCVRGPSSPPSLSLAPFVLLESRLVKERPQFECEEPLVSRSWRERRAGPSGHAPWAEARAASSRQQDEHANNNN